MVNTGGVRLSERHVMVKSPQTDTTWNFKCEYWHRPVRFSITTFSLSVVAVCQSNSIKDQL